MTSFNPNAEDVSGSWADAVREAEHILMISSEDPATCDKCGRRLEVLSVARARGPVYNASCPEHGEMLIQIYAEGGNDA